MSRLGKIARRTFLIGGAAIAGGVAFGVYYTKRDLPNPLLKDLADGEAAFNPFVKINADGITLITPRADLGQGAYSIQADLIAEELDIDPTQATITPGLPDPAYYNAALMAEGVPFPAYSDGFIPEIMRSVMELPAKLFQLQLTGGSSTVPDAYEKMRTAGAVARETLKEAAARRLGSPREDMRTENGHVIAPNGTRLAYTELAAEAAQIDPITDVTLRKSWSRLGKSRTRLDMVAKCTGTERYGIDVDLPGMVYAAVRANPGIGGTMERFDASQAQRMRGVRRVMEVSHGVAVIADNTWRAIKAVESIDVAWGPGPYPATTEALFAEIGKALDDEALIDNQFRDDGNVDKRLDDTAVTADYKIPYLAHAPLEPMNATVRVSDDLCEIWTGTQIPLFVRGHAADITGLDQGQIKVYVTPMGGSFGHRLEDTHVIQAVEIAKAMPGVPVKLTWSREEDMTHDYPRPGALARGRGAVRNREIEAFDLSIASSSVTASSLTRLMGSVPPGPDIQITAGAWDQPFAIPDYRVTGYRAPELVPVSSWRSVGASGNGFFHESFMDELIYAAGADPLEERLRLCHHDVSRKVLETVGEISNWNGTALAPNRGRGLAFTLSFGVPTALVTDVTQTDAGLKIDKVFAVVDSGPVLDPDNFEAQVFGGVIWGLSHAIYNELTYVDHAPEQTNYDWYEGLRLPQIPEITVRALENAEKIRGIGEPGVPPAAPSLGNAIFAATGQRLREMPFVKAIDFV